MEILPNWLEFGALGGLIAVVVLVLRFVFTQLEKQGEFAQRMADKAVNGLEDLLARNASNQEKTAHYLDALAQRLQEHSEEARIRDEQMLRTQRDILECMRMLQDKGNQ